VFLNFFKRTSPWIDPDVAGRVQSAIAHSEKMTSGEIRVFVERRCSYVDAVDRAAELFGQLSMHQTRSRNAVLVYWAVVDHQVAIYADQGIYERLGQVYWEKRVQEMLVHFRANDPATALEKSIQDIGKALQQYFPYDPDQDRNELSDTLLIGR
jgi:uncharacterized membrane protein